MSDVNMRQMDVLCLPPAAHSSPPISALKDPNDDMVLETAVNGGADRLVTFNRRDFGTVGLRFGIVACSPGDAVKLLEDRQ